LTENVGNDDRLDERLARKQRAGRLRYRNTLLNKGGRDASFELACLHDNGPSTALLPSSGDEKRPAAPGKPYKLQPLRLIRFPADSHARTARFPGVVRTLRRRRSLFFDRRASAKAPRTAALVPKANQLKRFFSQRDQTPFQTAGPRTRGLHPAACSLRLAIFLKHSTEPEMELLTQAHREKMLENGRTYQTDPSFEPMPVVKLFTPWTDCTWRLSDLDPDDHDVASGLCDLGFGEPEIGSVRISEIAGLRGPAGLRVERDLHFVAKKTISEYEQEARDAGAIRA